MDKERDGLKTVKLNYCGMGDDFDETQNLIYDILKLQGFELCQHLVSRCSCSGRT